MKYSDTLHLVLKDKWFQMYKDGLKTEEYREITPYWCNRLLGDIPFTREYWELILANKKTDKKRLTYNYSVRHFDFVTFHRGYTKETITFLLKDITIGYGDKNLGAPDELCFILEVEDFVSYIDKK